MQAAITLRRHAQASRRRLDDGKTYDLERAKIWEHFARTDQLEYSRACLSNPIGQKRYFVVSELISVREEDGEFGEPWTRGYKS